MTSMYFLDLSSVGSIESNRQYALIAYLNVEMRIRSSQPGIMKTIIRGQIIPRVNRRHRRIV